MVAGVSVPAPLAERFKWVAAGPVLQLNEDDVAKMGELLGKYRSLQVYMDACVHCGACLWNCMQALNGDETGNIEFRAGAGGLHLISAGELYQQAQADADQHRQQRTLAALVHRVNDLVDHVERDRQIVVAAFFRQVGG